MTTTALGHRGGAASARLAALSSSRLVVVVALVAGLVRLPLLTRPASPDEGGLLLVASQWQPGHSLYGNYWVDRPPLLLDVFVIAHGLGGLVALRLLGVVAVVASVVLAGVVGRQAHPGRLAPLTAAGLAAVLLCQARFGVFEVDGELLGVPVLLAGFALTLAAARAPSASAAALRLAGAGGSAAAALLIKQNQADVAILLAVGLLTFLRTAPLRSARALLAVIAGGATVTSLVLAGAAARGTHLAGLWEAVVTFRFQASHVIATSASAATTDRLHHLLFAALVSGLPLLLIGWLTALPAHPHRGELDLRWASAAVLGWEAFAVLGGGSYWSHYLIGLVPGLVLADAVRRTAPVALAVAAVACVVSLVPMLGHPGQAPLPEVTWLRDRVHPGDTAVVAYGHPNVLQATGLNSPYSELWSLPVRVRDPHLTELSTLLFSSSRPDWIVTGPDGDLAGWGISDLSAEVPFRAFYREVAYLGDTRIYLLRSDSRPSSS